jgi:hypothetical protein
MVVLNGDDVDQGDPRALWGAKGTHANVGSKIAKVKHKL